MTHNYANFACILIIIIIIIIKFLQCPYLKKIQRHYLQNVQIKLKMEIVNKIS